ncbi:BRCT domain-containing protein [Rheinheimera baltica]|uniref:BRCT domain-containing protein n=1 Tax=Rheinheimera baltica TaxID=67576 RepID=UPI00273D554D|nr:BRCT domain-containing protein [Rheinheimera baltica]MDP5142274.1 BRCT domain-containing protein [Rheinheimera baltica]
MTNLYQASDYWLTKDKAWLAERKAKWQRLSGRLKAIGFKGTDIRIYERYFLKGHISVNDRRDIGLGVMPEIKLILQLAWHPSDDEAVWWQVAEENSKNYDAFSYGYDLIQNYGYTFIHKEEYRPEYDNAIFSGREAKLYQFFFVNDRWRALLTNLDGKAGQIEFGYRDLFRAFVGLFNTIKIRNLESQFILYQSFPMQIVSPNSPAFTSELFLTYRSLDAWWWGRFVEDITVLAEFYVNRLSIVAAQREVVEQWATQIARSAPEWQAFWQQCLQDAQANYHQPAVAAVSKQPEPEQPEPTSSPDAFAAEPWPDELVALKQHLEQQGYPVTTTEADANAILQQHFANHCVYFGSFIESMQLETEDYDKPYPAFTAPLQALCDIKGDAKLSYTRRGERITIKVNGERLGVADLEEPSEDEDTSAYFAAIIRLAQQWFPGQVFAYGYESLHLYILPTELVSWLEANGFENSLNYFGDAATAEQPLAGLALVFTGVFSAGSREEMEDEAEQLGANVQKAVNSKTKYLVCGSKVGASKLAKAEALGVQVLTEAEYQAMISQGDSDPDYLCNAQIRSWQAVAKKLEDIDLQLFELVCNGLDLSYQQGLFASKGFGVFILSVTKNFISRRGWISVGFSPLGRELRLSYAVVAQNGRSIQDELTHTVTLSTRWQVNQDELDELLLLLCQMICDKLKWAKKDVR